MNAAKEPSGEGTQNHQPAIHRKEARSSGGAALIWILLILVVAGCAVFFLLKKRSGHAENLAQETKELAVKHVSVVRATSGDVAFEITLPGNLLAYSDAAIFARTSGYLKSWTADIGTQVKEGQVLATIEAPDIDAQLRQSNATLTQIRANLEIAELNFARQQELLVKKVSTQQEYDQARTNLDAQKAAVQGAEANVQNLTVQQDFQKLTAPFDGVVTRRNTDVGALISPSNAGQELFRVARTDILRVNVYIPQTYAALVQDGAGAYLTFDEFPGQKFQGKVAHIAGAIDPTTRTLLTEIQVDNQVHNLFPGAYANVHLQLSLKQAPLVVPVNALIFRSQGTQVAVVDENGVVQLRKVTIGHDYGTSLEITEGVTKDDRIVINPQDSLTDGVHVDAVEPPPAEEKKAVAAK